MTRMNLAAVSLAAVFAVSVGAAVLGCGIRRSDPAKVERPSMAEADAREPGAVATAAPSDVQFHIVALEKESRSGLYAYSPSATVKRKYTLEETFARLADGRFDEVLERPTAGQPVYLVGRLPGAILGGDSFLPEAAVIKGGNIDVSVKYVRAPIIDEKTGANAYLVVSLPALPAGKYKATICFEPYTYDDDRTQIRLRRLQVGLPLDVRPGRLLLCPSLVREFDVKMAGSEPTAVGEALLTGEALRAVAARLQIGMTEEQFYRVLREVNPHHLWCFEGREAHSVQECFAEDSSAVRLRVAWGPGSRDSRSIVDWELEAPLQVQSGKNVSLWDGRRGVATDLRESTGRKVTLEGTYAESGKADAARLLLTDGNVVYFKGDSTGDKLTQGRRIRAIGVLRYDPGLQPSKPADSGGKVPQSQLPHYYLESAEITWVEELAFLGTVKSIDASPLDPPARKNFVVVVEVDTIILGTLEGRTFSFRIHSPARSGLEVGKRYRIGAFKTGEGWDVDDLREWISSDKPPRPTD